MCLSKDDKIRFFREKMRIFLIRIPAPSGRQKSTRRYLPLSTYGLTKYPQQHGIKGFVIPTKSCFKIWIAKIFCYDKKMFSSSNKTFGCCSKIFGCSNKKIFVVPNFVAVTKPFFSMNQVLNDQLRPYDYSQLISLKMPRNKSYEYFN